MQVQFGSHLCDPTARTCKQAAPVCRAVRDSVRRATRNGSKPSAASDQEATQGEAATAATSAPDVDWHVALALAGCSFEAYDECEGDSLVERSPSGSTIRYVDE